MTQLDPLPALEALHRHGVRFVIVGGVAAAVHGSPRVSDALDISHDPALDNLERLAKALMDLETRPPGVEVPVPLDGRRLAAMDRHAFASSAGALRCVASLGAVGYEELRANAVVVLFDGVELRVASLDDLMAMQRASGGPEALIELEVLGALREELEARGEL